MTETDWTEAGCRIVGEVTQYGWLFLSCQSQAVTKDKDTQQLGRIILWVAQLGIPVATTRADADRLVRHWLAFYEDEPLARDGLKLFRTLFDSLPEHATPIQAPAAPLAQA